MDVWEKDSAIIPYFWVSKTEDKKIANMVASTVSIKDTKQVTILVNSVDIQPHTRLCFYVKPKSRAVPLANAKPVDDNDDGDDQEIASAAGKESEKSGKGEQPKAKAKRAKSSSAKPAAKKPKK